METNNFNIKCSYCNSINKVDTYVSIATKFDSSFPIFPSALKALSYVQTEEFTTRHSYPVTLKYNSVCKNCNKVQPGYLSTYRILNDSYSYGSICTN